MAVPGVLSSIPPLGPGSGMSSTLAPVSSPFSLSVAVVIVAAYSVNNSPKVGSAGWYVDWCAVSCPGSLVAVVVAVGVVASVVSGDGVFSVCTDTGGVISEFSASGSASGSVTAVPVSAERYLWSVLSLALVWRTLTGGSAVGPPGGSLGY